MKVNFYPQITQVFSKVTDKSNDKQGGAGSNAYDRQKKKDKDEDEIEVTDENVQKAVDAFSFDEMTKTAGITANAEGHGPGLKVVLKDASGGVLRSVSGEEFLKLRDAVRAGKRSGKLLDQKA